MASSSRIKILSRLDLESPGHNYLIYHFICDNNVVCYDDNGLDRLVIVKLIASLSMPATHELLQLIIQIGDYLRESSDNTVFLSFQVMNSKARCVIACILSFFDYYESPFDCIAAFSNGSTYFNSQLLFLHYFNKILLNIYPNYNVLQLARVIINIKTTAKYNYHFQLFDGNGEHVVTLQPSTVTESTLLFTNISIDEMLHDDLHIRLRSVDSYTGHMDTVFRTTLYLGYVDGIARVTKANIDTNYNIESNFFMDMFFFPFNGVRHDMFSISSSSNHSSTSISRQEQFEDVERRNTCLFESIKIRRKCSELKELPPQKRPLPSKFTITSSPSPVKIRCNNENNQNYGNELMATISELNEFLGDEIIF